MFNNKIKKNQSEPVVEQSGDAGKSINDRIDKLEKAGRRRGKIYLVVGISTSFLAAMIAMYAGNYLLEDIIYLTGKSRENIASIPEKRNRDEKLILFDKWKECLNNFDCVETQADCCKCNSGGKQTAINRLYIDEWEKDLSKKCVNIDCITLYACQEGEVVCENNKCEFREIISENKINNQDYDKDGLLDSEESKYGADPNNPDTDGDGYLDGDEVKNGYNPNGPGKL